MRRQRQWKLKSDETIKKDNKNGTIFPIKDAPEELQNVVKGILYIKIKEFPILKLMHLLTKKYTMEK